jgi:hypothetical protein
VPPHDKNVRTASIRRAQEIRSQHPALEKETDKFLTDTFIVVLNCGNHKNHLHIDKPISYFVELEQDVRSSSERLTKHPDYIELWENVKRMEDKSFQLATFTSYAVHTIERSILITMIKYLQDKEKREVGAAIHDGCQVERKNDYPANFDEAILRRTEKHILEERGYAVRLEEKNLTPRPSDWDIYYGEKALHKIKTDEAKVLYLLAHKG